MAHVRVAGQTGKQAWVTCENWGVGPRAYVGFD